MNENAAELGPWFQDLHVLDGTQAAPVHSLSDFPAFKWAQFAPHLPADLTGWRVFDVGCSARLYTLAPAPRGAHVTGLDEEVAEGTHGLGMEDHGAIRGPGQPLGHRRRLRRGQERTLQ